MFNSSIKSLRKEYSILLFMIVFIFLLSSVIVEASENLSEGINNYNKGDYSEAITILVNFLLNNPDNSTGYYYLGLSYIKLDEYKMAIGVLEKAHDLKPDNNKIQSNLARAYFHNAENRKAQELLSNIIEDNNADNNTYNLLGLINLDSNNYNKAIEYFEKAHQLKPDNYYVLNNMGYTYILKGEYQNAVESLEKAVSHNPSVPYIYNNLGISYENLGNLKKAIENYEKSLEINPSYKKAQINLDRVNAE